MLGHEQSFVTESSTAFATQVAHWVADSHTAQSGTAHGTNSHCPVSTFILSFAPEHPHVPVAAVGGDRVKSAKGLQFVHSLPLTQSLHVGEQARQVAESESG